MWQTDKTTQTVLYIWGLPKSWEMGTKGPGANPLYIAKFWQWYLFHLSGHFSLPLLLASWPDCRPPFLSLSLSFSVSLCCSSWYPSFFIYAESSRGLFLLSAAKITTTTSVLFFISWQLSFCLHLSQLYTIWIMRMSQSWGRRRKGEDVGSRERFIWKQFLLLRPVVV